MIDLASSTRSLDLSVVIVSYNTRELTLRCLGALAPELSQVDAEVFVVDNASMDGSPDAIAEQFPSVHLIRLDENIGFGPANNLAMTQSTGRYILLLNSDAFVEPGAITGLMQRMDADDRVAVVGPRLLNPDRSLQRSCWRFPTPGRAWREALGLQRLLRKHPRLGDLYDWPHDEEQRVDFVIGACMLVRRTVFDQTGGFDESFFLYAEETDWQRRIRNGGWEVLFAPEPEVVHLGGASGEDAGQRSKQVQRWFFEGQDRYIRKHHGRWGLAAWHMAALVGAASRTLAFGLAFALTLGRSRGVGANLCLSRERLVHACSALRHLASVSST